LQILFTQEAGGGGGGGGGVYRFELGEITILLDLLAALGEDLLTLDRHRGERKQLRLERLEACRRWERREINNTDFDYRIECGWRNRQDDSEKNTHSPVVSATHHPKATLRHSRASPCPT
jgi:hypothetical protein